MIFKSKQDTARLAGGERLLQVVESTFRWLISRGRVEEARQIFVKYHGAGDEWSPLVAFKMEQIEQALEIEKAINSTSSLLDLVRTAPNRQRTRIAAIIGLYASWARNLVISYYLTLVLDSIGIEDVASQTLINALLQVFSWLYSIGAGSTMDRIGRRPLWLISASGMCISFVVWTILSSRFDATQDPNIGKGVLAFIFIYNFFFTSGISPMSYAYPIELFPYSLRGRGLAFTNSLTLCGLIIGLFVNAIALTSIGWRYYILFCVLLSIMVILVYFWFPETKGRTWEEIAEIFDGPLGVQETGEGKAETEHEENKDTDIKSCA